MLLCFFAGTIVLCCCTLTQTQTNPDAMMDREAPKPASQTWKAIERQKKIIERGACFIVGDGVTIDIGKDPWVPWLPNFKSLTKGDLEPVNLVVACLINQSTGTWNLPMLTDLFNDNSVNVILKIHIPSFPRPNKLSWILNPNGTFLVKSAFNSFQTNMVTSNIDGIWSKLWKLKMHERLRCLFGISDPTFCLQI